MANLIEHAQRLALIGVFAILLGTVLAMPNTAAAQCCPTYHVVANNSLASSCFPLVVDTFWSTGLTGTSTQTSPGTVGVTVAVAGNCWGTLTAVRINGTLLFAPFNGAAVNLGNGCVIHVSTAVNEEDGCTVITIS